jgi:hypothetical protein
MFTSSFSTQKEGDGLSVRSEDALPFSGFNSFTPITAAVATLPPIHVTFPRNSPPSVNYP